MRILHVIGAVAPRYGGPSAAVVEMARALKSRGVEVTIATTDADGQGQLPVTIGRATEWEGIPAWFFPCQWSDAWKYSRPLARWLAKEVGAFDVLHLHGVFSHCTYSAAAAARRLGVPYVVRTLGHLDPWSLSQRATRKSLFLATAGRTLLNAAAVVHFTTEEERDGAIRFVDPARAAVIPLGVNRPSVDECRPAGLPSEWDAAAPPFALFLGRLHHKKRLEPVVDEVLSLPGGLLVVAGDGDPAYVGGLRKRAAAAPGRVFVIGWLGPAEKAWVFRRAALFVLLSHSENFGLAAAEAMAAGVPVFVSSAVNIARSIQEAEAGWVVNGQDASWTVEFRGALADLAERRRRGERARALALSTWNWPEAAQRLHKLYTALSSAKRDPRFAAASEGPRETAGGRRRGRPARKNRCS